MKDAEQKIKDYYGGGGWVSIFTFIRFWTGSFAQVEPHVPRQGTIIDLGCGYGIFSNYLGLTSPRRSVIGIDLDHEKIKKAGRGIANVSFRLGDATKMNLKNVDAILLLDVLHHLRSYQNQSDLIKKSSRFLRPGGKLIIVEVDNRPVWKLALAYIVDFILYKGQRVYYLYKRRALKQLRAQFGKNRVQVIPLNHNPFPHVLYLCEK